MKNIPLRPGFLKYISVLKPGHPLHEQIFLSKHKHSEYLNKKLEFTSSVNSMEPFINVSEKMSRPATSEAWILEGPSDKIMIVTNFFSFILYFLPTAS